VIRTTFSSPSHPSLSSQHYVDFPREPDAINLFQLFSTGGKAYEKRTKKDILDHPLASELQACDSPDSILAVLQGQVDDLDQARKSDERLTKWPNPMANFLLAFSATIGGGVSLVRIKCSCFGTII
jgi:hypothetical protein